MRMIPGMKSLTYEKRLRTLGLYSMEFRRMRGYLIEIYRMIGMRVFTDNQVLKVQTMPSGESIKSLIEPQKYIPTLVV